MLERYSRAITLAKTMVSRGVGASGLTFPGRSPEEVAQEETLRKGEIMKIAAAFVVALTAVAAITCP